MTVDSNGNEIITQTTEEIAAQNHETRTNQRINELSEKVKLTSQERDEKDRLLKESGEKIATLEKENAFNSGFSDVLGTHSAAKDHKDEIKAKVLAGYTVEDATYAVLGKAGKLGGAAPVQAQVGGGSADTTITQTSNKTVQEMSLSEKRDQLSKDLLWQ